MVNFLFLYVDKVYNVVTVTTSCLVYKATWHCEHFYKKELIKRNHDICTTESFLEVVIERLTRAGIETTTTEFRLDALSN